MNWQAKLSSSLRALDGDRAHATATGTAPEVAQIVRHLREAGTAFDNRTDSFAAGKGQICADIAAKLEKFGSFASDKQRDFALKLIEWSKPRAAKADAPAALAVPKLFAVMQKHADFFAGALKLSRKNQDSLVWIIWRNTCVGKIENAQVTLFERRLMGVQLEPLMSALKEFEADPLEAAKRYGRESGRCCSCGRDLTDPVSIGLGIGPICAGKFA